MENNNSKKNFPVKKVLIISIPVIAVIITCILLLTMCGNSTTDIVIKDSDKPRTTYVVGQDLDLSSGILTAIIDGDETKIPFSDPEISISGYDKNTIGKQTVTVTYKEQTTTFEVTVVARMIADGYKSEYFVGDSFDNSQGRLKITKDDGKTSTVALNSEFVSLKSFDSSKAGESVVCVVYDDTKGTVYEASFTVKVYAISDVTFTKPSKTLYSSHDTGLSLSGGYFTVTASGTNLSSYVELTPEMATGFDLSAATIANRETPLEQTIVFTYAGKSFNFKISILYSGVSIVKDAAAALADVNVTGRDVVIDPTLGATAIDAATEYFKLTQARKNLISEEEALKVMRPAAICVLQAFYDSSKEFENIFKIDTTSGNLLINAKSYDQLKNDMVKFGNKDSSFNIYAGVLNNMKEEFEEVLLFTEVVEEETVDVTIKDYIKSPSSDELSFYVGLFQYMLNVSDILDIVPDDWTKDTIAQYGNAIKEALSYITSSSYTGPTFNGVYNSISSWRTNNDYFEIIFSYYLYVDEDHETFLSTINGSNGLKLHLPGELQNWYTTLSNGAYECMVMYQYMSSNNQDIFMYDTTKFMYYYTKTVELSNSIKNNENKLYRDVYNLLGGDYMIYANLEAPQNLGYLYHAYSMLESEAFAKLWNSYMQLAKLYFETGKVDLVDNKDMFDAVLKDFATLTPSEVYAFICSLNFLYSDANNPNYAFDYNGSIYSILAYLMARYDFSNFEDSKIIMQLLYTMEKCAIIEASANGLDDFKAEMVVLYQKFNALSPEKQNLFLQIAGDLYRKYDAIYQSYGTTEVPELGDVANQYNNLTATIKDFYTILAIIYDENTDDNTKQYYYGLLFTLSEKAIALYSDILENGSDEVVKAIYTIEYKLADGVEMTIDNAMVRVRTEFYYNMVFYTVDNTSLWVIYSGTNLRAFMIQISDVLMAYYKNQTLNDEAVISVINNFRQLTTSEKGIFYLFGMNIYYDTLLSYFEAKGVPQNLARSILQMEIGYIEYMKDNTDEGRVNYYKQCVSSAKSAYNALGEAEKTSLNSTLKDFYNFYLNEYDKEFNSNASEDAT